MTSNQKTDDAHRIGFLVLLALTMLAFGGLLFEPRLDRRIALAVVFMAGSYGLGWFAAITERRHE